MKVLVVGSGGREHALAWAVSRTGRVSELFIAPGNGGTETLGRNVPIAPTDIGSLADFVEEEKVDLTVVGPEAPLVAGITDKFVERGLVCFGPSRKAARLEGSKVFAKEFMRRHGIPTAEFEVFDSPEKAREYVRAGSGSLVVKADGLAQGKGVYVTDSVTEAEQAIDEIMVKGKFGESGGSIVVEERLEGEELSVHALCCDEKAVFFPPSQDHKRAYDGDKGPNTGGMGAYAPVPFVTDEEREEIADKIIRPVLRGMMEEGCPYRGVLYAGLMLTDSGPKVLEFNVRFGDPETQVILPLVSGDLLEIIYGAARGEIPGDIKIDSRLSAAAVVMASGGYPGAYDKGHSIAGLGDVDGSGCLVFHAGTKRIKDGWITSGGRVLAVTGLGDTLSEAIARAYENVGRLSFERAFYRRDIGRHALEKSL